MTSPTSPAGAARRRRRPIASFAAAALIVGLPALAGAPAQAAPVGQASAPAVVVAAEESTTYKLGERTLRYGDRGPDVRALQKLIGVKKTKKFNKKTRKAVKKLERASGLKPNGVVSKRTLKGIKKTIKKQERAKKRASRSLPRAGGPAASKRYAKAYIAKKYGWSSSQHACLVTLWNRESGWRYWVSNPNGIYRGIPQTSSRVWGPMGYTTSQYMNSPEIQIKVGAKYIKNRYGTPCRALGFWNGHHWY